MAAVHERNTKQRERHIAVLKTDALDERVTHAMQLFSSMLWAFRGSLNVTWTASAPAEADVVVIHRQDSRKDAEHWRSQGKIVVEISAGAPLAGAHTLVYPFRAEQVRSLLERLDAELRAATRGSECADPAFSTDEVWSFVESLRAMRARADGSRWLVVRRGDEPALYVQSNALTFCADASTLAELRSGALDLSSLRLGEAAQPAGDTRARSGLELLWFAAYHASDRLVAPFDRASEIKLARWPNVSAIRPTPTQLRITAALASGALGVDRLAERARAEPTEVARTINALAAANLVSATRTEAPPTAPAWRPETRPRSGFTSFLRDVRRHLGLGASP